MLLTPLHWLASNERRMMDMFCFRLSFQETDRRWNQSSEDLRENPCEPGAQLCHYVCHQASMTTHLPAWSKMNFQKKSKPTASVAGRPSPKTLRKKKSTRSTKSETQVPPEDCENNNSQESLEQDFKDKLDLEGEFRQHSHQRPTRHKPIAHRIINNAYC